MEGEPPTGVRCGFMSGMVTRHLLKENFNDIQYLSTRESMGVDIIKQLTGRNPKLVLDPVFLLNANQWRTLASESRENKHKIIFREISLLYKN